MKNKQSVAGGSLALALILICGGSPVYSQAPPGPGAPGRDPLALYKATGINKDQESKIQSALKSFEVRTMGKRPAMMKLMNEMKTISLQPDVNQPAALAKQDQINRLNDEVANDRIKLLCQVRSILTLDQRKKLVQIMQPLPATQPPAHALGPNAAPAPALAAKKKP